VRVVVLHADQLHAGEPAVPVIPFRETLTRKTPARKTPARKTPARKIPVCKIHRVLGGQVLGMQVVGDHLGRYVEQPPEVLDPLGERAQRLDVLQVPMWCDTNARFSLARQNVFFSSAPQARTGRGNLACTLSGSGT
jgi:hypothetical protein